MKRQYACSFTDDACQVVKPMPRRQYRKLARPQTRAPRQRRFEFTLKLSRFRKSLYGEVTFPSSAVAWCYGVSRHALVVQTSWTDRELGQRYREGGA
jgi:hypothetical protein